MEWLDKYWPSALGALVLTIVGGTMLASSLTEEPPKVSTFETKAVDLSRPTARSQAAEGQSTRRDEEDEKAPVVRDPAAERFELVPILEAVPVDGAAAKVIDWSLDDPEVKAALGNVKLEMYEAEDCEACQKAREFFSHNGLSYTSHDVKSDSFVLEKMRRKSGTTEIPVILVDGQVVRGFSVEAVQGALTQAVKARLEG